MTTPKRADQIEPGDVLDMAAGEYRVDWLRKYRGGIECHCRSKSSRVLWFYPVNAVTVLRRDAVVAAKPFPEISGRSNSGDRPSARRGGP